MSKIDEAIEQFRPNCDAISKTKTGILIKPKKGISSAMLIKMHDQVMRLGGSWSTTAGTFMLPNELQEEKQVERLAELPLADLIGGPNPRLQIDNMTLIELGADIRENGLKQRIEVRPSVAMPGKFEIVDGNRRKRVFEMLGKTSIPAIIKDLSDQEAYETAFTVNNNRDGLSPLEQGRWFKILMEKFPVAYPSVRALAPRVGVSFQTVSRLIKDYETGVKLAQPKPKKKKVKLVAGSAEAEEETAEEEKNTMSPIGDMDLNESVIREIRRAPEAYQADLWKTALEEKLTAEQVRTRVERILEEINYPLHYPGVAEVIAKFPEKMQLTLRKAASHEKLTPEKTEELGNKLTIPKHTREESLKHAQERYAAEQKTEDAKRRAVFNSVQDFYAGVKGFDVTSQPPSDPAVEINAEKTEIRIVSNCENCESKATLQYAEPDENLKNLAEDVMNHFGRVSTEKFAVLVRQVAGRAYVKLKELGQLDELLKGIEGESS